LVTLDLDPNRFISQARLTQFIIGRIDGTLGWRMLLAFLFGAEHAFRRKLER
jgi:hypothetical protein